MTGQALTLFSWGYDGWGNWTDKLVEAVDAVEKARGFGPPVFIDIRAKRAVRAVGFRDRTFEQRFGTDRYRWLQGLGNKAILSGASVGEFVNPAAAADLLDLAVQLSAQKRRGIFFCSCVSPTDVCHRHEVAPALFKEAARRKAPVTVVEWPGYENDPDAQVELSVQPSVYRAIVNDTRASFPLGGDMPPVQLLALPWWTPVRIQTDGAWGRVHGGPAQYRAGGWQLPCLGGAVDARLALKTIAGERKALFLLPRAWPKNEPSQAPENWTIDKGTK